ncbi:MAG: hypothetical protein J6S41_00285, partial [Clostridia bacterium]|nr:hypothetical protein [Clostridia bacterium]
EDAQLELDGVKVIGNRCTKSGAAIYAVGDTVVTIKNSIIGGARHRWDAATDRYYDDGNISARASDETGGAIYVDYDASLYINNTTITGNKAVYGEVGAIFWSGDGRCELIDVDIFKNEALDFCGGVYADSDGTDIYIGGRVYIHDNCHYNGALIHGAISSNLHLEDDAANINRIADRPLTAGSKIGITCDDIDDVENDCITASGSKFEKADLSYFYYDASDKNGIVLRKVDQGTNAGSNQWALYATKPNESENEIPEITGAAVNTAYATSTNAVIDNTATDTKNRSVTLTVKKDIATKRFVRYAALRDFAGFAFFEFDTKILESAVAHDFVSSPTKTYTVMTPNGTFEYWDIKVVPEGGVWDDDPSVAEVNGTPYASFDAAWAAALNTPGSTLKLHADWLAGDMNSNGVIDPAETAGNFAGSLGAYYNGSLYVNQKELTVDLNGHKIDRMGGNNNVFYVIGNGDGSVTEGKLTITDTSAGKTGVITGVKNGSYGGAFYVADSKLFIECGTITGNSASNGGAIFNGYNAT